MNEITANSTQKGTDLLVLGFGTTVAMWAIGYLGRHPAISAPAPAILFLMVASQFAGGFFAGRYTRRGLKGGLYTGLISSILNLLILGSLLSGHEPGRLAPSAIWWLPGSLLVGMLLGVAGAAAGSSGGGRATFRENWIALFAWVSVAATFVLLMAGGVVTGYKAGLAVVDWPNSFGYNMFLYPLSRMTGGIYYEHAHRLLGSLVGLSTVVLALQIQRNEDRRWQRNLGWIAVLAVIAQGIMGGLRVTGSFTMSTSEEDMSPSIGLAIVHGVFGQVFFGLLAAIAVFSSTSWRTSPPPVTSPSASTDRILSTALIPLLILQIILGAIQRHIAEGLMIHISFAVIVVLFGIMTGVRAWGLYPEIAPLRKTGVLLNSLLGVQLCLGVFALVAKGVLIEPHDPTLVEVIITTLHQITGALLLATAVGLCLWNRKRVTSNE